MAPDDACGRRRLARAPHPQQGASPVLNWCSPHAHCPAVCRARPLDRPGRSGPANPPGSRESTAGAAAEWRFQAPPQATRFRRATARHTRPAPGVRRCPVQISRLEEYCPAAAPASAVPSPPARGCGIALPRNGVAPRQNLLPPAAPVLRPRYASGADRASGIAPAPWPAPPKSRPRHTPPPPAAGTTGAPARGHSPPRPTGSR